MNYKFFLFTILSCYEIFSCPNLVYYYEILNTAKESFYNKNFVKSYEFFSKIENCEIFYNTENNYYVYSLTIKELCINKNQTLENNNLDCKKLINKMIDFLNLSIKTLLPEKEFKKERSERYYLLGLAYFSLQNCLEAKKNILKAYQLQPNYKLQKQFENIKKICP